MYLIFYELQASARRKRIVCIMFFFLWHICAFSSKLHAAKYFKQIIFSPLAVVVPGYTLNAKPCLPQSKNCKTYEIFLSTLLAYAAIYQSFA